MSSCPVTPLSPGRRCSDANPAIVTWQLMNNADKEIVKRDKNTLIWKSPHYYRAGYDPADVICKNGRRFRACFTAILGSAGQFSCCAMIIIMITTKTPEGKSQIFPRKGHFWKLISSHFLVHGWLHWSCTVRWPCWIFIDDFSWMLCSGDGICITA